MIKNKNKIHRKSRFLPKNHWCCSERWYLMGLNVYLITTVEEETGKTNRFPQSCVKKLNSSQVSDLGAQSEKHRVHGEQTVNNNGFIWSGPSMKPNGKRGRGLTGS